MRVSEKRSFCYKRISHVTAGCVNGWGKREKARTTETETDGRKETERERQNVSDRTRETGR